MSVVAKPITVAHSEISLLAILIGWNSSELHTLHLHCSNLIYHTLKVPILYRYKSKLSLCKEKFKIIIMYILYLHAMDIDDSSTVLSPPLLERNVYCCTRLMFDEQS